MNYWNDSQGSNSQLLFFLPLHSNRVSMASHTEKQVLCDKIVLESMEGSCMRIGPGVDSAYALKQCSIQSICHTPDYLLQ